MSCELVEALAPDFARGSLDEGPRETVLEHAAHCPRCSARLQAERRLSADLLGLARATEGESAPLRVEAALRGELSRRAGATAAGARSPSAGPGRRRGGARWGWPLSAGMAASLLAVAFLYFQRPPSGRPTADQAVPRAVGATVESAEESQFVLLDYDEPLGELDSAHVVRVRLTEAALAGLGWVEQGVADPSGVTADVVIGPDGVARAIRVIDGAPERENEGGEGS